MTDYSNLTAKDIQAFADEHGEAELHGWRKDVAVEVEGLGSFLPVDSWNLGDGREMGEVVKHVESGKLFMRTGYYSSWDSSEWGTGWVEAKPYTYTETRYAPK